MDKRDKLKTKIYDKFQDVDRGISTPEQAISEIVKELDHKRFGSKSGTDDPPNGLYKVHWKSGGYSLASIGRDTKGDIWIAPSNWINGSVKYEKQKDMIEHLTILFVR